MTAPSIKEALEQARSVMSADRDLYEIGHSERLRYDEAIRKIDAALATLQPSGERREAIARRLKSRIGSGRTVTVGPGLYEDISEAADALLASGLVQDEAGSVATWMIQHGYVTGHGDTLDDLLGGLVAAEREKCAKIADLFVNHDAEYGAKYPDEAFKFDNRWLRSKTIADAIRSARDGGAES